METMWKKLSKVLMLMVTSMVMTLAVSGVVQADTSFKVGTKTNVSYSQSDSGEGWSYDPSTHTLTLNNFNYTGNGIEAGIKMDANEPLTINLIGNSTITMTNFAGNQYGILTSGDLTITGTGKLTIDCGNNSNFNSYGIYANQSITIGESVTVKATGGDVPSDNAESMGISCQGSIAINGNATVIAKGGASTGYDGISIGISGNGGISVSGNGSVTATGSNARAFSCGVYSNGNVSISGKSVTAISGSLIDGSHSVLNRRSAGIYSTAGVTITKGSVIARGGEASVSGSSSYGIAAGPHYDENPIITTGANVVASGQTQAISGTAYEDKGTSCTLGTPPQDSTSTPSTTTSSSSYDDDDDDDDDDTSTRTIITSGRNGSDNMIRVTSTGRYDLKSTGENSGIVSNTDGSLTFPITTGDGNDDSFDHFQGIQIDGWQQRREVDFRVTRGSTIITLNSAVIKNLDEGTHYLAAFFDDGNIVVSFDPANLPLASKSQSKSAPKTGEV